MNHRMIDKFYSFRQLEAGPRRDIAQRFDTWARDLDHFLPDGDDKDNAMRLLLEARDAAVGSVAALNRSRPERIPVIDS